MREKDITNDRPEEIPERFPDIKKMIALSDLLRDYEKGKIDKIALGERLREIESDKLAVARVYEKMTGEKYAF